MGLLPNPKPYQALARDLRELELLMGQHAVDLLNVERLVVAAASVPDVGAQREALQFSRHGNVERYWEGVIEKCGSFRDQARSLGNSLTASANQWDRARISVGWQPLKGLVGQIDTAANGDVESYLIEINRFRRGSSAALPGRVVVRDHASLLAELLPDVDSSAASLEGYAERLVRRRCYGIAGLMVVAGVVACTGIALYYSS